MISPVLLTKIRVPSVKPNTVVRPRLFKELSRGRNRQLTLVSAAAGYGKTTLISGWLHNEQIQAAWLSIDRELLDPLEFLRHFIAALQRILPETGTALFNSIQASQAPPVEIILSTLLNEIDNSGRDIFFVLDDYHQIDNREIDGILKFMLDHQPPNLRLIILTREDPDLPLSRIRAGDQLTELRGADLKFNSSEIKEFLGSKLTTDLSSGSIEALEARTEGWITGLQLAGIILEKNNDAEGFIRTFTGSHVFVMDYLMEEVLNRQPEALQNFLVCTSILDRLCGSLCDALIDSPLSSGQKTLEYLEQVNMFLTQLDDERCWYRYHHLFSELLRQRLDCQDRENCTGRSIELHHRASVWYEANGFEREALHHAFASKDYERAAWLLEMTLPVMDAGFQSAAWLKALKDLPEEIIQNRPVLLAGYAQALMDAGEFDSVEELLNDAEKLFDVSDSVVADPKQYLTLPATIANVRAYHALSVDDGDKAVFYARKSLELCPAEDILKKGIGSSLLGLAYWLNGDLESACNVLDNGIRGMGKAGNTLFVIGGLPGLVEVTVARGELRKAAQICREGIELAEGLEDSTLWVSQNLHLALCQLFIEENNLGEAMKHYERSVKLAEHSILSDWPYRSNIALAKIKAATGECDVALSLLEKAETLYVRNPAPDPNPAGARKARLWIRMGFIEKAREWVDNHNISPSDSLSYLKEFEHITLVRLLIAEYKNSGRKEFIISAEGLIDRLLEEAEKGKRTGSFIEILLLKSIVYTFNNDHQNASETLARSLTLAEPEGYVRVFTEEGGIIEPMLTERVYKNISKEYATKLSASFIDIKQSTLDPLSPREIEVLELIEQGLSNSEIGERLFLALTTIKGYNQRIFSKLGVKRRTEAVARARDLEIL